MFAHFYFMTTNAAIFSTPTGGSWLLAFWNCAFATVSSIWSDYFTIILDLQGRAPWHSRRSLQSVLLINSCTCMTRRVSGWRELLADALRDWKIPRHSAMYMRNQIVHTKSLTRVFFCEISSREKRSSIR
jgi:hypothetical protein